MSKRALKPMAVLICLVLVAFAGAQSLLYHTSHLQTPYGAVGVGMTLGEVEAILGPSVSALHLSSNSRHTPAEREALERKRYWVVSDRGLWIDFDRDGRAIWLSVTDIHSVEPFIRRLFPW